MKAILQFAIPNILELSVFGRNRGRYERYCHLIGKEEGDPESWVKYESSRAGSWCLSCNDGVGGRLLQENPVQTLFGFPVFFETTYQVRCRFLQKGVTSAIVLHPMKSVTEKFCFADELLDGWLDFVNWPGRFTLEIHFVLNGRRESIKVSWWVVSEKIDVLRDAKEIKAVLEHEMPGFVHAFLTPTQGRAGRAQHKSSAGDEWLDIFRAFAEPYVQAVKLVVQSPHLRYQSESRLERAENIRRWSPHLANTFARMGRDQQRRHLFRVETTKPKLDSSENRFVLFTLQRIGKRLGKLLQACAHAHGVSEEFKTKLVEWETALKKLESASFFKGIGPFEGFRQENLVLQRQRGYSKILETWVTLQHAIDVTCEGFEAGNRPMWKLYEFWCFLTLRDCIANMVNSDGSKRFSLSSFQGGLGNLASLADAFEEIDTTEAARKDADKGGNKCMFVFRDEERARTVRLAYQQSYSNAETADLDGHVLSHLVEQIPDIVLDIVDDCPDDDTFTYLFDAKYRVMTIDGKDAAKHDTLNEMHRYRDAILYRRTKLAGESKGRLKREVLGAFVLYPGRPGNSVDYDKFIQEDNIGAIPLLPRKGGTSKLREVLERLLDYPSKREHFESAIPPRGTVLALEGIGTPV